MNEPFFQIDAILGLISSAWWSEIRTNRNNWPRKRRIELIGGGGRDMSSVWKQRGWNVIFIPQLFSRKCEMQNGLMNQKPF